jgi:UDP-N-acetylglucosamine 2-epimerase
VKIVTVVGARPQFIKAAPVSRALRESGHREILVHTGQHYDDRMSRVFFDELNIPDPDVNLGVGSGDAGWQTAQMLMALEQILTAEKPDYTLVYGDTTSTLAGALAACKTGLPLAHVEAGLRSFNRTMPEEHNRVMTDHCADVLFCPTRTAVSNLALEGLEARVQLVGDTMYDAVVQFVEAAHQRSTILNDLQLRPGEYFLLTVHRAYNADEPEHLSRILAALPKLGYPVIFPVHPRTRKMIAQLNLPNPLGAAGSKVMMLEPLGYFDMLALEEHARAILTDSGGMQKEAYFLAVPCLTLRPETEWVETLSAGWNKLVGTDTEQIVEAARNVTRPTSEPERIFGQGDSSERIRLSLEASRG